MPHHVSRTGVHQVGANQHEKLLCEVLKLAPCKYTGLQATYQHLKEDWKAEICSGFAQNLLKTTFFLSYQLGCQCGKIMSLLKDHLLLKNVLLACRCNIDAKGMACLDDVVSFHGNSRKKIIYQEKA